MLVTTGSLTKQAKREAEELNVKTVEGEELSRMIADWDLSDIAANYLAVDETDSTTQPVAISDDPVEAYEGSPQWNKIEGFNEMVETPQADTYELVATLDGDVAYRLTHGTYCDGVPDSFVNIHTLRDYSAAEKEELNRVSDVFGIRFRANVVADGDRAIYDKIDALGQLKTRRTVRIGRQIVNRVHGRPFADIEINITRV